MLLTTATVRRGGHYAHAHARRALCTGHAARMCRRMQGMAQHVMPGMKALPRVLSPQTATMVSRRASSASGLVSADKYRNIAVVCVLLKVHSTSMTNLW
eukprot:m.120778 g.120778  ORF g.120778 m.120778 type:complete len:99 (+) comp11066_c0_seq1:152-448(+)